MDKQAIIYKCAFCSYLWLNKRNYDRHKRLYHHGIPMIENIKGNKKSYVLDFIPSSDCKPIIYTCVLCMTNFPSIDRITTHNLTRPISLMRQGHIKISKVEHDSHTSWTYRKKCSFRPMCVRKKIRIAIM